MTSGTAGAAATVNAKPMKYFNNPLFCLAVLVAVVGIPAAVIHSFVDKSVDNSTYNEPNNPSTQLPVQADASGVQTEPSTGEVAGARTEQPARPPAAATKEHCGESEAEKSGWKVLSCDPLRLMPLAEWEQKSASPHFRYRPELYCFDESNFAGVFHEVEPATFPDPNWLSEVKMDNGCSFFFHPNQGQGNGQPD